MSKGRLRVLYIQKPPGGGTATGLYDLVRGLNLELYEPIVLFLQPNIYFDKFKELDIKVLCYNKMFHSGIKNVSAVYKRDIAASLSKVANWIGVAYVTLKQCYLLIRKDLTVAYKISRLINDLKIDIVHQNNNLPADRATVLGAIFAKVPQVCHIRTLKRLSYIEKVLSRFIHAFIYMSKSIENLYIQEGIPVKKGNIIYDAFNADEYEIIDAKQVSEIKSDFGILNGERLVGNVGRIVRWKGQDVFIKAMAEVIKKDPRIKAIIVGPTNSSIEQKIFFNELKKLTNELGLANHVIFTGFRSDIPQIMASSDVIVHSSTEPEPFGRVIVEGMLAGKPVVATAAGGVLDIIHDEVTGLLVPIKDSKAMANAISYFLKNPEIAKRISDKSKEDAIRRFNVNQHVKAVQNIYQQIMEAVH
jgi:glycosyltransferase involved in cell wall biosynthesis